MACRSCQEARKNMKNAVKDGDMKKVVEVAATGIKIIGGKLASRIPAKK